MSINFDKYIYSTGTHYISNSGSDERGRSHGGTAGDQTGKEWQLRSWYNRPWTVVLRYPDIRVALRIAQLGIAAALNDNIGYDQYQRTTYWSQLQKADYNPSRIDTPCEDDCTAGVTANVKATGYLLDINKLKEIPIDTYSANMRSRFVTAGFKALTDSKYTDSPDYLLPGDILLYEGHHAATNITYGDKVRDKISSDLCRGDTGKAVEKMQRLLTMWKPGCLPKYGADGDFGKETEEALRDYQKTMGLPVTGVYDAETRDSLEDVGKLKMVRIINGDAYIRSAPNTETGHILGVAKKGKEFPYQGVDSKDGWHLIEFSKMNAWVSGKYSQIV